MNKKTKGILKSIIPPFILDVINTVKPSPKEQFGWFGSYNSWEEASRNCEGYDSMVIFEKVKSSLLKVKTGEAVYERDSVLFDEIQYSWPLLSALLRAAQENDGVLNVLDFGGSLGSTYYQNKEFLFGLRELKWNIVEQMHFVDTGRKYFQDNSLKFYESINDCLKNNSCNVLLLSGVLQYLDSPFDFLKLAVSYNIEYIIIDRTAFINGNKNRITIQRVPPEIYEATYPCWFFNEQELISSFDGLYKQVAGFEALDKSNIQDSYFKGFIYKRILC